MPTSAVDQDKLILQRAAARAAAEPVLQQSKAMTSRDLDMSIYSKWMDSLQKVRGLS